MKKGIRRNSVDSKSMKTKRNYEDLKGTEKEVCDLCRDNQEACDDNTELCIAFWDMKQDETYLDSRPLGIFGAIRKYKPESLTKYRRNLADEQLIFPSEKSKEHSIKMEAQNHQPVRNQLFDIAAHKTINSLTGEKL